MDGFAPAGGPLPGGMPGPAVPAAAPAPPPASAPVPAGAPVPARPPGTGVAGEDPELDEYFAWLVGEIEAGRVQAPPESAIEGPAVSLSLGDACDVDPVLLAAMCGPDGLGGQALPPVFAQGRAAD
ncbi:MAG TPA: hypothetical protein VHF26_04710, partial [Trebonia sp.]|nr:hypothetical protein [Trebonia sp.]